MILQTEIIIMIKSLAAPSMCESIHEVSAKIDSLQDPINVGTESNVNKWLQHVKNIRIISIIQWM